MTPSSLSRLFYIQLVLKVKQQADASCCWVCHGRFHGVLPKEHPGAFYDVPWGLYKEMPTNNHGQSDIVTHSTNIWNKEYRNCCKRTFLYTYPKNVVGSWFIANLSATTFHPLSNLVIHHITSQFTNVLNKLECFCPQAFSALPIVCGWGQEWSI